jgi:hypothetical protein
MVAQQVLEAAAKELSHKNFLQSISEAQGFLAGIKIDSTFKQHEKVFQTLRKNKNERHELFRNDT